MLVLRSARRPDLNSMLQIEKLKTIFNQKKQLRVIGHNPNSTKFQLANV